MKLSWEIGEETLQDLVNIGTGLFHPLGGFMSSKDYHSVVEKVSLDGGAVWSIPVTLDVDHDTFLKAADADRLFLTRGGREVGYVTVEDCFRVHADDDVPKIFGTGDARHPGVSKERGRREYRVGGAVTVTDGSILDGALRPEQTRQVFREKGWETVVAFNTRNPIHRAHEYLQRVGLELCDGLFVNPLTGWKKSGDFSEEAVMKSYEYMIGALWPPGRVHLAGLRTTMRYSGPREAVFHAVVRRNLGCTHIIIGRDHAGVGDFYGTYEAQEFIGEISRRLDLGITPLLLKGPFYCSRCGQIVTERTCAHGGPDIVQISGTEIRTQLNEGRRPDERFMRPEVADIIIGLGEGMFIGEEP